MTEVVAILEVLRTLGEVLSATAAGFFIWRSLEPNKKKGNYVDRNRVRCNSAARQVTSLSSHLSSILSVA